MAQVFYDFIAGSKNFGGKRKSKAKLDRELREEAQHEKDKAQAEWIMANMSYEINCLRIGENYE